MCGVRPKFPDIWWTTSPKSRGRGLKLSLHPFWWFIFTPLTGDSPAGLSHIYLTGNEKILSDYGTTFVAAWKNTHNYRVWNSNRHPALAEINPK